MDSEYGTGTRSFVAYDDAGNTSSVYTFVIVKDTTGPEMETSEGRDLKHLVTVPSGETGQPTYQFGNDYKENWGRSTTVPSGGLFYDWYDASYHQTTYWLALFW